MFLTSVPRCIHNGYFVAGVQIHYCYYVSAAHHTTGVLHAVHVCTKVCQHISAPVVNRDTELKYRSILLHVHACVHPQYVPMHAPLDNR